MSAAIQLTEIRYAAGCTHNVRGERRAKRVRSSALFGADPRDLAALRSREGGEQLGNEAA